MSKEKKQFRELSDEELKKVNGGFVPTHQVNGGFVPSQINNIAFFFAYDLCAEGVPDLNGKCPQM